MIEETVASLLRKAKLAEWRAQQRAWRARAANLRTGLEAEFLGIPEVVHDDLWNWAYAEGHSSGLSEIGMYYREVAQIVEKAAKAAIEGDS